MTDYEPMPSKVAAGSMADVEARDYRESAAANRELGALDHAEWDEWLAEWTEQGLPRLPIGGLHGWDPEGEGPRSWADLEP